MRVTHVITRLIVGGAQENTIQSVLGLAERPGFQAELISGPTYGAEGSLEQAFVGRDDLLTVLPELVRPVHPWKDALAYATLVKLFRERKPDVVHTHSGKAGFLGRRAAARAGVPIVVHTIHGPSFGDFQSLPANLVFRAAERLAGRVTTHFIAVAEAMKEQYLRAGIGSPSQYSVIYSGFDLEPFLTAENQLHVRARYGLYGSDVVVGIISRLFKLKGHDDLIDVAPRLVAENPSLKFLVVGGGEWKERLERRVRAHGLTSHFVFTGLVTPEQVPQLVGIMDMLVHLSRREGLARALPQALAASRPVIAYDCDGASEVCLQNQTGFLVRPGDLEAVQNSIAVLAQDPGLRERLGNAGRSLVEQRFRLDGMVEAIYRLYMRLVSEPVAAQPTLRLSQ